MDSFNEAWEIICDYCKERITDVAYKTWISKIEPVNLDFTQGKAILMVPGDFHRQTLIRGYMKLLNDAFASVFGPGIEIIFTIPDEEPAKETENQEAIMDADYEYTFDTFIVGSSNKFAHAASLAVATNPGKAYNPLFIYGNSGLGKTHLLYAIRNEIIKTDPNKTITYVKGDDFTNEFIESLQNATTSEFRQKYRKSDVLLVDDIQFIGGKERTQEEFFHTFNTLREANCQIVLTSDRPPKEIKTLEDRLRSRFESGLLADIQPPDYETRMAIIKRKAELLELVLPDDVTEYIATRLKTNIRQLEGVVKKLKAKNQLYGEKITINVAQKTISDILNNDQPPPLTVEKIIDEVAHTYGITSDDIRSQKRNSNISNARQIAIYAVREITSLSMKSIGEEFGGRDHSTIVYAINQIEKNMSKDPTLKSTVEDIIKNIRDR
ncbi:MAG: chromosomal replication initiator protein DnaA [Clostridia bacterium]|nr:chromosomal replication initiator protein DnaA [Clostridia bacterium]